MPSIAIIGGGVSGLTSALFIHKALPNCAITLFESDDRLGGKIRSEVKDGFLFEHGPNGFMDSRQEMLDLCDDLDLNDKMIKSNDASAERFIRKNGKLKRLPKKPPQIFTSNFLPFSAKLRLMMEPFVKKSAEEDETIYSFAKRRLGTYMAENVLDPFTSGVFGSDCRKLSLRSAFPALRELEQEHGSLFKGIRAKLKNAPKNKQGKLSSFTGGMEDLIKGLRKKLETSVKFLENSPVSLVTSSDKGATVEFKKGAEAQTLDFDAVITACPAEPTALMLSKVLGELKDDVKNIPYSSISVVPQGFKSAKPDNINAFGYLIPSSEPSKVLGVLFDSCVFDGRAPDNNFSLRTMVGGGKDPDITKNSDEELLGLILAENRETLGIDNQADIHKIIRWQKAIPRYEMGHWKIIEKIEEKTANSAVFITGNAFYGVSMNDCVTASIKTADRVKNFLENK
ncbi:MAG: protoporphyrinogen oxidase [Lentisphaeraceae bacterium]|nr:protoporphyrinogen oxidase [Lentisphaeraceae bacterium]